MNSKGLAQLAYEKGMYILTAAQGYQEAQEVNQLGHGLLTYALVEEGLKQGMASKDDGNIYLRDWLNFAVSKVPQLQTDWLQGVLKRGFSNPNVDGMNAVTHLVLQQPRVFYRRELEAIPFIVARSDAAAH